MPPGIFTNQSNSATILIIIIKGQWHLSFSHQVPEYVQHLLKKGEPTE